MSLNQQQLYSYYTISGQNMEWKYLDRTAVKGEIAHCEQSMMCVSPDPPLLSGSSAWLLDAVL